MKIPRTRQLYHCNEMATDEQSSQDKIIISSYGMVLGLACRGKAVSKFEVINLVHARITVNMNEMRSLA